MTLSKMREAIKRSGVRWLAWHWEFGRYRTAPVDDAPPSAVKAFYEAMA